MPEPLAPDGRRPARGAAERSADHAAIDRLADTLLPALIGRLTATGLGELEVREGAWRVRLRRPAEAPATSKPGRRSTERPGDGRGERTTERSTDRSGRAGQHAPESPSARTDTRSVATSPAVGIYRQRPDLGAGERVREGDRLGVVDMLGVPQEVVSPATGLVGTSLVQSGDAVEYGQELLIIELAGPGSPAENTQAPG